MGGTRSYWCIQGRSDCGWVRVRADRTCRVEKRSRLVAFTRILFVTCASGPLPLPAPLLLAGPVLAASPAARPPFPPKCAENGDIDTPGHVAFDNLHFIL